MTSNVANVSQVAALAAVSGDLEAVAQMRAAFERRGHTMHALLSGIPDVRVMEPQGAFYAFPNLSAYLGHDIRGTRPADTVELCGVLLEQAKVAVVPGEAFDAPGYARLSFALGDDDLGEGCRRIAGLLAEAG
jgi:aspartate/methionine/tyrosine aminotransferase